ncbi:MAG: TilS substrate-binding domain-containing protein [Planctomycetes bacterium]|nr:TilS substrate-binding domain-containing protein [Planctomycetota bacterium]
MLVSSCCGVGPCAFLRLSHRCSRLRSSAAFSGILAAELRRLLHRWLKRTNAKVPTPEQLEAFRQKK